MKNSTLLTVSAALAIATGAAITTLADTHTVSSGTQSLSNITETSATIKDGAGTLELSGANSLKRIQVKAGTLHVSGGTTAVSDSAATGTGTGAQVFEQVAGDTIIDGGATLTLSAGQYAITESGILTIKNATLNANGLTGHFMNAFRASTGSDIATDGCKIVIDNGGVFRTAYLRPSGTGAESASLQDYVGVELKTGGNLYLTQFWADNTANRYGRIWFNGGVVHTQSATPLFNWFGSGTNVRWPWGKGQLVPTVMGGGCHIEDNTENNDGTLIYPPFKSGVVAGEKDGGVHLSGKGWHSWFAKDSDFNGGFYLESTSGGMTKLNETYGDSVFGAVPSTPETNIWVVGSNHTLYNQAGTFSIHPNRTIFIKNGKGFRTGSQGRLIIGGEIKGECVGGLDYPTNTYLEVRSNWTGSVAIGPGESRTNDVGRMVVGGTLEITNGVTMIASATAGAGSDNSLLYISAGNAAASGTKGRLQVMAGGVLSTPQTSTRYVVVANYGQADICGGIVDMQSVEWLNALNNPALTIVRDGGFLNVGTFRITQGVTSGNPTVVRLGTNGIMRVNQLALDLSKTQPDVTFLFDGGAIQSASGYSASDEKTSGTDKRQSFIRDSSNAKWAGVKFVIGPGGAVFDTDNDKHLYWHRPLVKATAGEPDGGITVRGNKGKAVIFNKDLEYNGPTTVDGDCTLQLRAGSLPTGTKLVLRNGGKAGFTNYDNSHTPTAATLDSIEGNGTLTWCRGITVTNAIVPSIGGTITLHEACALDGVTLEIAGDAIGCGKVKFESLQDISHMTVSMKNPASFDTNAAQGFYKIVENGNYSGTFTKSADWPSNWDVKYKSDGVYLHPIKAFVLIVR